MRQNKQFLVAILATAALLGSAASANATISNLIYIPDSEVLINFNSTGLDWVYAGPIAPNEFGPGNIQPATYRSAEGWRTATESEWTLRPIWSDFTRIGFSVAANPGFSDHAAYRFTSEYWSDFTHVDLNDFAAGNVTDGVNGVTTNVPETIYVRSSAGNAVPEPATWAMMIIGFGAAGSMIRRRKAVVA